MAAAAMAQQSTVRSQIKSTDGQPVSGAIISIVGDSTTALSDERGQFSIATAIKNAIVTIKAEGYYPKEMPLSFLRQLSAKKHGTITLVPENEVLYSEKANSFFGSLSNDSRSATISSIESKDFTEKQNLGAALRDGLAGLQVIEKSGMPGEGSYMNIRGIHSFVAENNPLIVINGVPYFGNQDVSSVINGYSRDLLFGYDPKDIRSVTVLKGADAAMYGSLGSNGVIVIETQQATSNNLETRMTFSGSYGFNIRQSNLPVLNSSQYKEYLNDIGLTRYPSMESLIGDYPFLQNGTIHGAYTYNNIIRGSLGLAVDGTSASGVDAPRWGFFPSAGVTMMVANLGVLPSWVNRLNVSVEGSLTGNSRFSSNYGKNYYTGDNFFDIGSINRSNVPNTKLEWEKKTQLDLGLDMALFANRVNIGFTYFTNHAYDLLLNSNVSAVYGSYDYYENCGTINTNGIEASLRVNAFHTKDWDVVIGANISTANSTIKSLGDANSMTIEYTGYNNDDAELIMAVGSDPYEFYGYQTNGIFSTTDQARQAALKNSNGDEYQAGDVWFVDQNNDGVIDESDKVSLGSNMPDFYGGINLSVRYRRFVLDANFAYSVGAKVYNATRRELESMDNFYNQSAAVLNRWQVEGQQTNMPRANYGDPMGNNLFSDRWIEDGDFLKLRSLKLSYNFDMLFNFIRSGNIYVAAENLFSLTNYLGHDPEFAYSYAEQLRGFDYSKMPLPITVRLGFNINF